jgi:hypothetical protein
MASSTAPLTSVPLGSSRVTEMMPRYSPRSLMLRLSFLSGGLPGAPAPAPALPARPPPLPAAALLGDRPRTAGDAPRAGEPPAGAASGSRPSAPCASR